MGNIGARVRREREAQGVSREDLAKAADIGVSTLSDLEIGRSQTSTKLHRIAERLNVRTEWLETGKGAKQPPQSQHMGYEVETILDAQKLLREYAEIRDMSSAIADDPHRLRIACKIITEENRLEKPGPPVDLMKKLSAAFKADREKEDGDKRREVEGIGAADGGHRRSRARKA